MRELNYVIKNYDKNMIRNNLSIKFYDMSPMTIISILVIVSGLIGCSSSKKVSLTNIEPVKIVDSKEFYTTGLAEISGKVIDIEVTTSTSNNYRDTDYAVSVGSGNIATGEVINRFVPISKNRDSFHNWFKVSTPAILLVRGMPEDFIPVYVQAGKNVEIIYDNTTGKITFSGDMGRINNELYNAPQFDERDSIINKIAESGNLSPQEAIAIYEEGEKDWKMRLDNYLVSSDLSAVTIRLLKNTAAFKKAFWLLDNEESLGVKSPDDYAPLKAVLLADDRYLLAQQWTGGLVDNLAGSKLLKKLAKNIPEEKTSNYNEAVMRYMKRFDAMLLFFDITGMPELAQLAVARTLCKGGFLKKTKTLDAAMTLADTVISSYIPNPDIAENVRSYARRVMHNDRHYLTDSEEADVVNELLAPYKGKYVIMDFWLPKCKPCLKEMQDTRDFRESARGNKDWVILYVVGEDYASQETFDKICSKYLTGDECILLDHTTYRKLSALFEVSGVPRKILFGRDGEVIDEHYVIDTSNMPR